MFPPFDFNREYDDKLNSGNKIENHFRRVALIFNALDGWRLMHFRKYESVRSAVITLDIFTARYSKVLETKSKHKSKEKKRKEKKKNQSCNSTVLCPEIIHICKVGHLLRFTELDLDQIRTLVYPLRQTTRLTVYAAEFNTKNASGESLCM
jgi:hypothetical protein